MRMDNDISSEEYKDMKNQLTQEKGKLKWMINDEVDEKMEIYSEISEKMFQLAEILRTRDLELTYHQAKELLELLCSNLIYNGENTVFKPTPVYESLHKTLVLKNGRGDRTWTCDLLVPNQAL